MPINLEMPKLSDTMTEGTVVRWLKKEGDQIEIGDEVAEIETDKATMAMEAFDEGILAKILIPEGGKAAIGSVLAVITAEGESLDAAEATPAPTAAMPAAAAPAAAPSSPVSDPVPAAAAPVAPAAPAATPPASGERIKSSPLARKIAADQGVDLAGVTGTGPGGRIVKADVVAASKAGTATPAAGKPASPAPAPAAIAPTVGAGDQRVELSSMRRIIADRLLTSKTTIPHFYLHLEVDAAPLMAIRKQVNAQAEVTHGNKYTVNDFILKSVINALQAVPAANASFNGDHIVQFEQIGIAVAVAIDDGLVTPVVKNAAAKSLLQISKEVKDLATRARDKKLKPDEFDGGTITVSNLGAYGIESFDAIINPPQAAILSVGAILEKPVVVDGQLTIGLRMNLGLSCDHRVVDGAVGAQLLGQIKKLLENPALMLV
ncbi:MAG: pyruvate dehydrogenase complex dihydrolipoamide acetyltransferase [Verrucomicrobia bacterium]|nr:pyruvate dehydrogenase complex dihydrolipoamide acetyltransferase [Verrucomicrobiota bacterium]MDA1005178.1 pyruvate dehydrogenase complex dihydrolipoamide acetyltransferase [Verrucomicrobiota bacterium]